MWNNLEAPTFLLHICDTVKNFASLNIAAVNKSGKHAILYQREFYKQDLPSDKDEITSVLPTSAVLLFLSQEIMKTVAMTMKHSIGPQ